MMTSHIVLVQDGQNGGSPLELCDKKVPPKLKD